MRTLLTILCCLMLASVIHAAETGDAVVVIYNLQMPGSKDVAEHYAAMRKVPTSQVFGFALTTNENISRKEFHEKLELPLVKALEAKKLWRIGPQKIPATTNGQPAKVVRQVLDSKIRYAVLCYGVPLRIEEDSSLREDGIDSLRPELRRNEAAVDSDLAILPGIEANLTLAGPLSNPIFRITNAAVINPTNGILMVTRLDGPTAEIARGLVDKAMIAETNGLCGRAYFDLRNASTNSPLILGDQWIYTAAKTAQYCGYETTIDTNSGLFPADFPMSQIGIYCGWYAEHACGPFAQKTVEFMPGAFAYHLHSFSAATIRSTTEHWVGPFLARGATCTMGCVWEPYLSGTPDVGVFCARWMLLGFTFGEAAYASQQTVSWQTTVVGDPLYCPFRTPPARLLVEQSRDGNKSMDWTYLRLGNMSIVQGKNPADVIAFFEALPETKDSAVLTEKLANLYNSEGMPSSAIESFEKALKLSPSPMQAVRIRLELADKLIAAGRPKDAYTNLKDLVKDAPDFPGNPDVKRRIDDLANQLGQKASASAQH